MLKLQLKSFLSDPRVLYVFQEVNIVKMQVNTIHSEAGFAFYGFIFLEKAFVGPVSITKIALKKTAEQSLYDIFQHVYQLPL